MSRCRCRGRCGNPYCNWDDPLRTLPGWRPHPAGPQVFGFVRDGQRLAVTAFSRDEARAKLFYGWDVFHYDNAPGEPDGEVEL